MGSSGRSRELAALRLTGGTRRQVQRILGRETAGALPAATVLGVGIAPAVLTG